MDKIVEMDEGFFESVDIKREEDEKSAPKKRGWGSQKQRKVLVMASTIHDFSTTKKYGKPTKFRYIKIIAVDDLKRQTVGEKVSENIKCDIVVKTDN